MILTFTASMDGNLATETPVVNGIQVDLVSSYWSRYIVGMTNTF